MNNEDNTCGPVYYSGRQNRDSFASAIIEVSQEVIRTRDQLAQQESSLRIARREVDRLDTIKGNLEKQIAELKDRAAKKELEVQKLFDEKNKFIENLKESGSLFAKDSKKYWDMNRLIKKISKSRVAWSNDQKRVAWYVLDEMKKIFKDENK